MCKEFLAIFCVSVDRLTVVNKAIIASMEGIFAKRAPLEVARMVVRLVSVFMIDASFVTHRGPKERMGDSNVNP